jgi:hypothetical protein
MSDRVLEWLVEKDNPSVRYFALRDLLDCPTDDRELQTARRAIMRSAPVKKILAAQSAEGYWAQPGCGYAPKYRGTVWTLLLLTELGADGRDKRNSAVGTSGPNFACSANGKLPCAWGAVKVLRALTSLPETLKSPRVKRATDMACEFLLNGDLARANYPHVERISGVWFKFGFPLGDTSDLLETLLALSEAGHARDPRWKAALELVVVQRDAQRRWALKNSLNGKMWIDLEEKNKPSKWVTLRARRVLKAAGVPA